MGKRGKEKILSFFVFFSFVCGRKSEEKWGKVRKSEEKWGKGKAVSFDHLETSETSKRRISKWCEPWQSRIFLSFCWEIQKKRISQELKTRKSPAWNSMKPSWTLKAIDSKSTPGLLWQTVWMWDPRSKIRTIKKKLNKIENWEFLKIWEASIFEETQKIEKFKFEESVPTIFSLAW